MPQCNMLPKKRDSSSALHLTDGQGPFFQGSSDNWKRFARMCDGWPRGAFSLRGKANPRAATVPSRDGASSDLFVTPPCTKNAKRKSENTQKPARATITTTIPDTGKDSDRPTAIIYLPRKFGGLGTKKAHSYTHSYAYHTRVWVGRTTTE